MDFEKVNAQELNFKKLEASGITEDEFSVDVTTPVQETPVQKPETQQMSQPEPLQETESTPTPDSEMSEPRGLENLDPKECKANVDAILGVSDEKKVEQPSRSFFTSIDVEREEVGRFAKEYSRELLTLDYVGSSALLLKQAVDIERRYRVTLPLRAYGLEPVVFYRANCTPAGIPPADGKERVDDKVSIDCGDTELPYELLNIDGINYLSCCGDVLDESYLYSVIAEAKQEVQYNGSYKFPLVGLRLLRDAENGDTYIVTLRLNTYEMSILVKSMTSDPGVTARQEVDSDGHSCLYFTRSAV